MNKKRLKALIFILNFSLAAAPVAAYAGKLDFLFGAYSFQSANKRNSTSRVLSGLGSYHFGYRHIVSPKWELAAGYSLLATKTITGDLSFGFDLGVNYFFLTTAGPIEAKSGSASATYQQLWRPFVGVSFHQRNFQSTSSQYAGAGVRLGLERPLSDNLSGLASVRYMSLGGPNQSSASQVDVLVGIMCSF